jgi:hypothetical protein
MTRHGQACIDGRTTDDDPLIEVHCMRVYTARSMTYMNLDLFFDGALA